MAAVLARTCLSTLCCLALPAVAQDASIRFGEQTTRTEQTTRSSNTQTRNSGVSASGDIGAMATQSTTRYSSQSEMRSKSKAVDVDVGAGLHDRDDDRGHDRRRSRDVRDSDLFGRWARRMAAPEPSNCADVPPRLSSEAVWSPILNEKEIGREEALFRRADHRLPTRS
ncbi:hypothetical protein [Stenotrophomonas riyadhensis]